MRLWWTLGLVILGAAVLGQLFPLISTDAEFSGLPGPEAGQLRLVRPSAGKADRRVNEEAERLIAAGIAEDRQGHPAASLGHFQDAVRIAHQSGAELSEARALVHSGDVFASLGDLNAAFSCYEQAREKWGRLGSDTERLRTLQAFARLYLQIVEPARAIDLLREADKIDPNGAANLHLFGMAFYEGENAGFGLGLLRRALDQARLEQDTELEALVLADTASVAVSLGKIELAAASLEESLRISQKKSPQIEAYARAGRGSVLGLQGQPDEARAELDRAASMFRSLGEPESLAIVLGRKALLERRVGNLDAALALSRAAIELIEAQRLEIRSPRARAAWLGASSDPYEIQIEALWELAQREPGRGHEARAFEISEQIRARTLYEALAAGGTSQRAGTADLQRQRREVTAELRKLESEKLRLFPPDGEQARAQLAQIEAEVRALLTREGELWERLRRSDPRSALAGLQPLDLSRVQALLDPDTALLAYTLGKDRSFAWWIERGSLTMFEIPARAAIEETAGEVQSQLADVARTRASRSSRQLDVLLTRLSELVLAPVANRLPRVRRLAIVPDGALQTIPFAVLPRPRTGGGMESEPMVASHVLVLLPSPSTLAALRRRAEERDAKPDKLIAVIAYPVFNEDDPRFARAVSSAPALGRSGFGSLPQTEKEAGKILGFVPRGMGRAILGFEAAPEIITDPDLRRYRYIHFGTHGVVDPKTPELSGIVLSGFMPDGRRRTDDRLHFYDVYDLDLPADLVSLSTCRSADGPQIRREGPITMTRSFLYAGASRVLGTLWNVRDEAAQELTTSFYEGILREGKTPADALRDAQDAMRRDGWRRRDWAAFVLQGDWR